MRRVKVSAPVPSLWDVLKDCPRSASTRRTSSYRSLEILGRRAELFSQTIKTRSSCRRSARVPLELRPACAHQRASVSSPIDVLDGNWWLSPADGSVLLVNELGIDIGLPIPVSGVRRCAARCGNAAGIRDRVEAA
jgi:hypothetical protein